VLNEFTQQSNVGIVLEEDKIPIKESVKAACELLGFDPLYVANEGKLVAIAEPGDAGKILAEMQQNIYGRDAAIIGEVSNAHPGRVIMKTKLGPSRVVDMLSGELLPRIC
jgi:hydrogenase expression/formation protein HypE